MTQVWSTLACFFETSFSVQNKKPGNSEHTRLRLTWINRDMPNFGGKLSEKELYINLCKHL